MKKLIIGMVLFLLVFSAVAAEECQVYDTVDQVYLTDSDCDGWPDEVPKPENYEEFIADMPEDLPPMPELYEEESEEPVIAPEEYGSGALEITYMSNKNLEAGKQGVFFPIKVTNHKESAEVVSLRVEPITAWGTYRIEPRSTITIMPGTEETIYVFVKADFDAEPGSKTVYVNIQSESEDKNLRLTANVISEARIDNEKRKKQLETGLIVLIIILLIIGLIIGYDKLRKAGSKSDDKYSYY